jgi:ribonuclease HIII
MELYSENKAIASFTEKAYVRILEAGFIVIPDSFREIDYGITFKVIHPEKKKKDLSITIYHTEKKGFSFVTSSPAIRSILLSILTETGTAGSDEAGKGDFFGPLTVCCFILGEKEKKLLEMDVKDSKKLGREKILMMYRHIQKNYSDSYSIIRINPDRYNTFYENLKARGKNLNSLLAWAHSKAIANLLEKRNDLKKIIVDQFSSNSRIISTITEKAGKIPVEFRIRAEQNPAVAIASILARAEYLTQLDMLSEKIFNGKIILSSGSGPDSDIISKKIIDNFGEKSLRSVCKVHFDNFRKISHA